MNVLASCDGCVFSIIDSGRQTGCKLNRTDKFTYSIGENGIFNLERFCNTYRPQEWLSELSVNESEDISKTVLEEIYPRVGFFVFFNGNFDELEKTILDIHSQSIKARYVVVINDKVEYNEKIHELFTNLFDFKITQYHIVQILVKPESLDLLIDESFKHAKNGWAYVCNAGEKIDTLLIEKIHKRINIDLKRLVVVKPYDENLNGLLFQAALFKFLNGNHSKIFIDDVADNRKFLDKVESYSLKSDPETFIDWEEFNAA